MGGGSDDRGSLPFHPLIHYQTCRLHFCVAYRTNDRRAAWRELILINIREEWGLRVPLPSRFCAHPADGVYDTVPYFVYWSTSLPLTCSSCILQGTVSNRCQSPSSVGGDTVCCPHGLSGGVPLNVAGMHRRGDVTMRVTLDRIRETWLE